MMAQDPCKAKIIFSQEGDWDDELSYNFRDKLEAGEKLTKEDLLWIENRKKEILGKSNQKAFLAYQWGVWVTAWSRYMLELGIKLVHETPGAEFIYCDTDSIKYTGEIDWSKYNEERIRECFESGSYATDTKGVTHYMGVFESEDLPDTGYAYRYFKSLGAKKYAYVERDVESWKEELKIGDSVYKYTKIGKGRTHCTIAGVNKAKGGKELDNNGGLEAFREGFVFRDAGGTQAVFNDNPQLPDIEIDGHKIHITANVAILPSEYTLGITGEYERIIKIAKGYLDNPFVV